MSTPTKEESKNNLTKCAICDREFKGLRGLANHISQAHDIAIACYYDMYIDPSAGKCLTCDSQTSFHNIVKGYRDFCSVACIHKNQDLLDQRAAARLNTYKKDPTIMERLLIKRAKTLNDNPYIMLDRKRKIAETIRNNPSIVKESIKKRKETLMSDPSIQVNATRKSQSARNSPGVKAKISKNISIGLREYYANLYRNSSTIDCSIYLLFSSSLDIVKIGITSAFSKRLSAIQKDFGPVKTIKVSETTYDKALKLETTMHKRFKEHCQPQPKGAGKTEWYDQCIKASALDMLEEFESSIQV